jgi:molybdopterin molybdotransferase
MLTVTEALRAVLSRTRPLPARPARLMDSLGLVLAGRVAADIDLPPFDKSLVDGFALRSVDVAEIPTRLRIVEEILAGQTPTRPIGPGEAAAIMTGAPMPDGADAVVMVEKTNRLDAGFVLVNGAAAPGQNRLLRGREMKAGEIVAFEGAVLNAARLGVLASIGVDEVLVRPRPIVAVAATGDEIVPFHELPGPGQIRNSNTAMLTALALEHGATARPMPIAPDRPEALRDTFARALAGDESSGGSADVLVISGGVSAGRRDLVPEALEAIGIEQVFHKVKVKPGKPLWFGMGPGREGGPPSLVFGLPGNPVSGLVSFLLFVRPALAILSGQGDGLDDVSSFPLASSYRHSDDRDVYQPARLTDAEDLREVRVEPLPWSGSSDLRAAATGDGFAIFPAGERTYRVGDRVGFLPLIPSKSSTGISYNT